MSLPQYLTYLVDDAYCFFTVENKEMDSIQNKSTCKLEVTGVCCRGSSHHTERESRSLCQERKRNFFFFLPLWVACGTSPVRVCERSLVSDSLWPCGLGPPDSSVHGIFQAKIREWAAISYFRGSSRPRDWTCVFACPMLAGILFHCTTWEDHGTSWTRDQICHPR